MNSRFGRLQFNDCEIYNSLVIYDQVTINALTFGLPSMFNDCTNINSDLTGSNAEGIFYIKPCRKRSFNAM